MKQGSIRRVDMLFLCLLCFIACIGMYMHSYSRLNLPKDTMYSWLIDHKNIRIIIPVIAAAIPKQPGIQPFFCDSSFSRELIRSVCCAIVPA